MKNHITFVRLFYEKVVKHVLRAYFFFLWISKISCLRIFNISQVIVRNVGKGHLSIQDNLTFGEFLFKSYPKFKHFNFEYHATKQGYKGNWEIGAALLIEILNNMLSLQKCKQTNRVLGQFFW